MFTRSVEFRETLPSM